MPSDGVLLIETRGAVEWVTLNRPDQGNALDDVLVGELIDYFEGLRARQQIRVVVLRANGRHFCAGLDMSSGAFTEVERTPNVIFNMQRRIASIYLAMRKCPQPIISLLHGAACGGGFSLALASDMRIAGASARMNAAYIKIGLTGCDMGSSYFLPRLVGVSVASELLMTGRFIHAPRALAVNLVSEVVPDTELEQAAQLLVDDLLRTSPMGLRLTKESLNINIDAGSLEAAMGVEDRHQALLSLTEDAGEAGLAFFEKRDPVYQDR
ncbi:MAG: enoyl-CoA hydratase/isomerase family protein [Halioglobus sp.]|nr:enoyl-CoA hydratase/isomerase family protein [Halioglobus sp.]